MCECGSASNSSPHATFSTLEALRAFALLLGVVFHAAESLHPGVETYWAIADRSPSETLALFRYASHSFRLELFFLIAGFFAHLLYHRRGQREVIRNRVSRIVVPLVIGWAVLYPILVYLWLLGASASGRLEAFGVPAELASAPPAFLTFAYIVLDVGQKRPEFAGYAFDIGGTPMPVPHWSLHVWLYEENSNGIFTSLNCHCLCRMTSSWRCARPSNVLELWTRARTKW
jgi:hypothetical protein